MATWKKVIVSGSAAELKAVSSSLGILIDSENAQSAAGYMAISASSTSTASFGHLLGDASQLSNLPETEWDGSRNGNAEISGSLILTGSAGRIPSLEIVGYNGGVGTQKIGNTSATTFLSGSFNGDGSGLTGVSATNVTTVTDSADTEAFLTFGNDQAASQQLKTNASIKADLTKGIITATGLTGSLEGNVVGDLTGNSTGAHNGTVGATSPADGKFTTLSATGDVALGNDANDTVTVAGDLIVKGNTTEVRTTNLNIEDQFILLQSGSDTAAAGQSGIIFGGLSATPAATQAGSALFVDKTLERLSVSSGYVNAGDTSATVGAHIPLVTTGSLSAVAQVGNFKVDAAGDLFVYAG